MNRLRPSSPWLSLLLALVLTGASCGAGDDDSDPVSAPPTTTTTVKRLSGEITVLAAASLTEAFTDIGEAFSEANPGAGVKFSFAGSSSLALQANAAPADLFASADDVNMKRVTDAGNASNPRTFTRNRLALIVQKGNPLDIAGLAVFNRSDLIYVICKDGVPCGTYGQQALTRAGVTRKPASLEADVKGVVTKVTTQQADAGIVYATDAKSAAGNSDSVDIPDDQNVIGSYPIAVLKQSSKTDLAVAFIDFILSPPGQTILAGYGFLSAS